MTDDTEAAKENMKIDVRKSIPLHEITDATGDVLAKDSVAYTMGNQIRDLRVAIRTETEHR
jgi:hypothetical protein